LTTSKRGGKIQKKLRKEKVMNTIKFNKKNVKMVAHRGVSGLERENTNAAFVAAGNRSYFGVETDLYRTIDGHYVLLHDGNLQRVGNDALDIPNSTLDTIRHAVLLDKDGTKDRYDLRVPTLLEYIKICKRYEKYCVLELKGDFPEEQIKEMVEIINTQDYLDHVIFISFWFGSLVTLRKVLPKQKAQFLCGEISEEFLQNTIDNKFDLDIHYGCLTDDMIKRFHDAGLEVNVWTVDNPEIAEQLVERGVDYITSNILE